MPERPAFCTVVTCVASSSQLLSVSPDQTVWPHFAVPSHAERESRKKLPKPYLWIKVPVIVLSHCWRQVGPSVTLFLPSYSHWPVRSAWSASPVRSGSVSSSHMARTP